MPRYRFWANLRYRPLQFSGQRYPTLRNVTSTLPTVSNRYRSLPNFNVTCVKSVTSVTDRNKGPFEQIFKVL